MRHLIPLFLLATPALSDPPAIEAIIATRAADGWRFDVTLRHPDTGWDHYADGWRVLDLQGNEIGMRTLFHPHETEQPFTRSLGNVQVPEGARQVQVQARCNLDGWAPVMQIVDIK
ncbi:hypothetical protein OEZ49_00160 [Ruegeria sp. WL0004]|uniref:Uncharacterized protein n=1 Tax=Ruegeria marisflavi TaxID=2984152 RepID=A0ABT2WJU2_9RHOB|nr:hypothetical protein [Ruegeria sp. WL0004]MCU9836164.1 hypothetical protein [Ruegeria sp. WL0004]